MQKETTMINICLPGCCSDPMTSLWIGIISGLFTGLISGLYASLIVTRYARFAELQTKALYSIRNIDYVVKDNDLSITGDDDSNRLLTNISCDLFGLEHKSAGNNVAELAKEIKNINQQARTGKIKLHDYEQYYLAWQNKCRKMRPNLLVVLSLKVKL